MSLNEKNKNHWFISLVSIAVVFISATYGVINAIRIAPLKDEISRLDRKLSESKSRIEELVKQGDKKVRVSLKTKGFLSQ